MNSLDFLNIFSCQMKHSNGFQYFKLPAFCIFIHFLFPRVMKQMTTRLTSSRKAATEPPTKGPDGVKTKFIWEKFIKKLIHQSGVVI